MRIYNENNRQDGVGSAYAGLARAAYALGEYDQAWEHVETAIRHLLDSRHFFWMFYALATAAVLLAQQGQGRRAAALYGLILRYDFVAKSKWFADAFGRYIEPFAVDEQAEGHEILLPHDVWSAARELLAGDPL